MELAGKVALVTGVTGTVGDRAATRLVQEGARVRGLIRKPEQAERLREIGVEPVLGELTDRAALDAALAGVNLVVHSAAYLGADAALAKASNIDGVGNLAEAALAAGVERFVHISTINVYGDPLEGEVDESHPLNQGHEHPYVTSKAESERILTAAAAKGLPLVILRPGAICAEQNSHWGDGLIRRWAAQEKITWTHPEDMIPWVHTDNLIDMILLASTHPAAVGETYNAIDGNYSSDEFLNRIARALGKEVVAADRAPERAIILHAKIQQQLGYRSRRTFAETVAALEQQARDLVR